MGQTYSRNSACSDIMSTEKNSVTDFIDIMLSIFDSKQPMNRRAMLQIGGLGLAGATGLDLSQLLAAKAEKNHYTTG